MYTAAASGRRGAGGWECGECQTTDGTQHCTVHNSSKLHLTTMNIATLYCTAVHYNTLYGTTLNCTALHFTALHCTALHCTALCFIYRFSLLTSGWLGDCSCRLEHWSSWLGGREVGEQHICATVICAEHVLGIFAF